MRKISTITLVLIGLCFLFEVKSQSFPSVNGGKDCFPHWVFLSKANIGVSDAIAVSTDTSMIDYARTQAVQRALFLYAVKHKKLYVESNITFYEKSTEQHGDYKNDLFENSIILKTKLTDFSYSIRNEYISPSGEVFVNLDIRTNVPTYNQLDVEGILKVKIYEDPIPSKTIKIYSYTLSIKDNFSDKEHFWKLESPDNKTYTENTVWKYGKHKYKEASYFNDIAVYGNDYEECGTQGYFTMYGTYWKNFFTAFADNIVSYSSVNTSVGRLENIYNNSDELYEAIKQLKYSLYLNIDYSIKDVKDNKLNIYWTIKELKG